LNVAEFSVRQTVLVNLLFFVCLLGGLVSFARTPVEFFPDVNLNTVNIFTGWAGASADEVERLVTQKLEEELGRVSDIDEMRSTSRADLSTIIIDLDEFLNDVEYEAALNDVRAAIDRVRDLPADADEPFVTEIKSSEAFPAASIAVVDVGSVGERALREVARDVRARTERLRGVSRSSVRGAQEREIRVLVDRDAAARHDLTVLDVSARIRSQNLNLPAGTFGDGSGESTLRARGDYQNLDEILATVVKVDPGGNHVRLSEIATLEEGLEKRLFVNRYNGLPAQIVTMTKKTDADVIELSAGIDAWIEGYRPLLPEGVEIHKTLDTSRFVESRMGVLVENLITGIFFVVAILWFTIGFRNALLTSIAIPFSFLTAMILFPVLDITINSSTLIGMLLVSGMLVDDAIIVLENVYRRVEEGEPLREAVISGTSEVMWPVICAVATTIAAFAPLLLVGGTAGKFVSILPKAVVVCLAASLMECLIILPAHYLHLGSRKRSDSSVGRGFAALGSVRTWVERGIERARDRYVRALDVVLEYRLSFAVLIVSVVMASFGWGAHLDFDLFPGEFDSFNVMVEAPPEYSLDQTDEVVSGLEVPIGELVGKEIRDFSTTVGTSVDSNYDRLTGPNLSMSFLVMPEGRSDPERVLLGVRERLEAYREENPRGILELRVDAEQDGPPVGPPVQVRIAGDDYALGKSIAAEIVAYLRTLPGVYDAEDNLKLGPEEVRLVVDEERAAHHGLTFQDLALALRAANDGTVASTFRDPTLGEDIDIRVLLEGRQRRGLQDVLDVEVSTPAGYLVRLRDVADIEVTRGFRSYQRYDEKRTVSVSAQIDENATTSLAVNQALIARFADLDQRFPQVEVRYGGEFEETSEAFAGLIGAFPISLISIYMILAALFRSYLQPLVVTAAIPFGFVGIIVGVGLMGYTVSFVLLYAAIGLTGVVVNDSLVMVDFINRARRDGLPMLEAVRQSGARRFRPILLTTLTTVVALLPMALGIQGESKTYGPFAAAISFGLIAATAGTLFAVPLFYSSILDVQGRLGRRFGGLLPGARSSNADGDTSSAAASKQGAASKGAS
jgi:multidrug efflux pump subunit AcrB